MRPTTWVVPAMLLVVTAAGVRTFRLSLRDIWVDEANTVLIAERPIGQIIESLRQDSSPPLFYFVLHCWMKAFGRSEAAVRSLSVLSGVLLVSAVFAVGGRLISPRAGLYAALLMVLAPIQVAHSQEVRMYALLPLAALGAMYFTYQSAVRGHRLDGIAMTLCTLGCLYVHNYGFFLLPAQAVFVLLSGTLRTRIRHWVTGAVLVALGYFPWLPVFLDQWKNHGQYAWLEPMWRDWGLSLCFHTMSTFAVGWGLTSATRETIPGPFVALTPVLWGLAVVPLAWPAREPRKHLAGIWLACFLLVPLLAALGVSIAGRPCYVAGRCDQLVYAAFVLLAGTGLDSIRSAPVRRSLVVAIMAGLGGSLFFYFRGSERFGDRDCAMAVVGHARPGQAVICTSLARAPLEYYARLAGRPLHIVSYPRDTASHLGNQDDAALLRRPEYLVSEAEAVVEEVIRHAGPGGEFILVEVLAPVNEPLSEAIAGRYGAEPAENLGAYAQTMLNLPIRVSVYRTPGEQVD